MCCRIYQMKNENLSNNLKLLVISFLAIVLGIGLLVLGSAENASLPMPIKEEITPMSVTPKTIPTQFYPGVLGQQLLVVKVIDGDTIEIEGGQKVRLIGIDTPETVDPRRPVGCFGKEASSESTRVMEGKTVALVKDISETDRFGRLLRYVYVDIKEGEDLFVNLYLVENGFARAATFPPDVKYSGQFKEAETEARENNRGLWNKCPPP